MSEDAKEYVKVNKRDTNRENELSHMVYAANKALWKADVRPVRREGFFRRLFRWNREHRAQRRKMKGVYYYSAERKREAYAEIFRDCCAPVYDFFEDFADNVWDFLCEFAGDFKDLILLIADGCITVAYYAGSVWNFISDHFWNLRFWAEARKATLFKIFAALVFIVAGSVVFVSSITAYEYSYYGKTLGYTKSKDSVYRTIDVLGDKLSEASGANIAINVERDMEFKRVRGFGMNVDSDEDILNTITYMKDLQVEAYAIIVDDVPKVIMEDEAAANRVLAKIRARLIPEAEGVEYTDVRYREAVGVLEQTVSLGEIWSEETAVKYLMTGSVSDLATHKVASGETLAEISAATGINESVLIDANPDIDIEALEEGQIIKLAQSEPVVNVISTEVSTYFEDIDYGIQYIDNSSLYSGDIEIKTPGVPGKRQVVATVNRINGVETERTVNGTQVVQQPVAEIQYRGTKPVPERVGTGTFKNPLKSSYILSSHVGPRWGRAHEGIDMAAPIGTKIYACDGGTVIYSGWLSGLGYCVKIDHGGLFTTVYGHCSKLLVEVGDQVFQGQNIALMGSTGNSTGSHLHLELRYNGEVLNPLDYLE